MAKAFRHAAGFGRRMEYWLIGRMLKEGLDVYVPLVDDFGIDAIVRKSDGSYIELQIKARSDDVVAGNAALFAAIVHEARPNYYFVFHSERLNCMWIMSSEEFIAESAQNRTGKNKGKRSIWFNGKKVNRSAGEVKEHAHLRFEKYRKEDFSIFR